MIFHFVLNPKSGRSKKQILMEQQIVDACAKRQLNYHIYYTTAHGDATNYVNDMVKKAPGERQRFICVGGDGTINEIANSVPGNSDVEFGVIPNGSGNDFVRNFTNLDLFSSIDAQLDGERISLDLIKCNDDYCVNMVNIGFDCSVVIESDKFRRTNIISPGISYILGVLIGFFKKFGTKMKLVYDDGTVVEKKLTLTAIGNGKFCGGGFMSAPLASLTDGLFDICSIDKVSRLQFISLVGSYKAGSFLDNPNAKKVITYRKESHFKMEFDQEMPICIDGEITHAKTVDFSISPKSFNFVIPKGCELRFPDENN